MRLNLKTGEHIRIKTDKDAPVMVWIDKGVVHVTAQPHGQPTRVVIGDSKAKVEWEVA